jgi:hypothetical protein
MKPSIKTTLIIALAITFSLWSLVVVQARYKRGGNTTWYDILHTCRDGVVINIAINSAVQPSVDLTGTLLSDGTTIAAGTYLLENVPQYIPGIGWVPWSETITANWNTTIQPGSRVGMLLLPPDNLRVPLEATVEDCLLTEAPAVVESMIIPDPTGEETIPSTFTFFPSSPPACITVTIPVTLTQPVGDLNLSMLIDGVFSPEQSAISASLTSPAGTTVQLFENANGNFGERCKDMDTNLLFDPLADFVLDDDSVFPFSGGTAPYTSTAMIPAEALDTFRGENAAGDWTLDICNNSQIVGGGLWCVYMEFDEAGTVSGHLYLDSNGNGAQEGGEPNLSGVDVHITDSEINLQTVSSDGNGDWVATVPPGNTTVSVNTGDPDFPNGATQTEGDDPTTVTAVAGTDTDAGNDGYYLPGTVSGHLYEDTNGNGSQAAGEPDLANVDIIVTDSGSNSQTVATNANGDWTATVPPGTTSADVDQSDPDYPVGYTQTEGDDPTTVTAVAGADTDAGNDGYYLSSTSGTVSGHLYEDTNGNGSQAAGEPDLANVDIIVTDSSSNSQTVATNANGDWTATVPPGTTTIAVDSNDPDYPAGAVQIEGSTSSQVTAVAGETVFVGNYGYYFDVVENLGLYLPLIVVP